MTTLGQRKSLTTKIHEATRNKEHEKLVFVRVVSCGFVVSAFLLVSHSRVALHAIVRCGVAINTIISPPRNNNNPSVQH